MAFAYVRYLLDAEEVIVPVDFIKNFDKHTHAPGAVHLVFWSPDEDETPRSLEIKQGFVLEIEKISDPQLPGYYKAEVLLVEETREALENRIDSKRVIKRSAKLLENKVNARISRSGKQPSNSCHSDNKKLSKKEASLLKKQGEKTNLKNLRKSSKSTENAQDSSDSDSADDVGELKPLKEEIASLQKQLKNSHHKLNESEKKREALQLEIQSLHEQLECAYDNLRKAKTDNHDVNAMEKELTDLRALNLLYQTKFFSGEKSKEKSPNYPRHDTNSRKATPNNVMKKLIFDVDCDPDSKDKSVTNDGESSFQKSPKRVFREIESNLSYISPVKTCSTPKKLKQSSPEVNLSYISPLKSCPTDKPKQPSTKVEFSLSPIKYDDAIDGINGGRGGDSLFIKNLSLAIWGSHVLKNSSVSGKKSNAIKDSTPKPELCKQKKAYLKGLFEKRLTSEGLTKDDEMWTVRLSKMNYYITEKIGTLNYVKKVNKKQTPVKTPKKTPKKTPVKTPLKKTPTPVTPHL